MESELTEMQFRELTYPSTVDTSTHHEESLVRAFILKNRQERSLYLLSDPDRRLKLTVMLAHFRWLDERFARPILPTEAFRIPELAALLRKRGAGDTVWAISQDREIDGRKLELVDALTRTWGSDRGTFLSCIPGKLVYFKEEEGTQLLER